MIGLLLRILRIIRWVGSGMANIAEILHDGFRFVIEYARIGFAFYLAIFVFALTAAAVAWGQLFHLLNALQDVSNMVGGAGPGGGGIGISGLLSQLSGYMLFANAVFPVQEGIYLLNVSLTLRLTAIIYRLYKSWIPTLT